MSTPILRDFNQIKTELNLRGMGRIRDKDWYCVPVGVDNPRILVKHFNGLISPSLIPSFVDLLNKTREWLEQDRELSKVVYVERPLEVGSDFIAIRHLLGNTLRSFFDTDEPICDIPAELEQMQSRFRELAAQKYDPQTSKIIEILSRAILDEKNGDTLFIHREDKFVITDLVLTPEDLML